MNTIDASKVRSLLDAKIAQHQGRIRRLAYCEGDVAIEVAGDHDDTVGEARGTQTPSIVWQSAFAFARGERSHLVLATDRGGVVLVAARSGWVLVEFVGGSRVGVYLAVAQQLVVDIHSIALGSI